MQYLPLTLATYPQLVREACHSIGLLNVLRRAERGRTPETRLLHVGAVTDDGLLVGYASAVGGPSDGVWLRPGHFKLRVYVDESHCGRGVGSALYQQVERFALVQGARTLDAEVGEGDSAGLAFAQHRGFAIEQHLFASTLDLTTFDAGRFAGVLTAAEASGIRFTSYAAYPQDDTSLQRFRDLLCELHQDVPGAGDYQPTLEQVRAAYVQAPNWEPSAILFAADSAAGERWVALAHLTQQEGGYYNTLTGVQRSYRGHGLAQAIKVKAAEYARSKGAAFIRTHNDSNNAPMLAVNRKLGYRPQPGYFKLVRRVDRS